MSIQVCATNSDPSAWGINEPKVLLVTAILAAAVAIWGILTQRSITARQATLEFISRSESDETAVNSRHTFNKLSKDTDGLLPWAKDDKQNTDEAKQIKHVLNEIELISISIQRGIMDDALYRRFFKDGVIKTWQNAQEYVHHRRARTGNQLLYHEVEQLALWYKGDKPNPRRNWFVRRLL